MSGIVVDTFNAGKQRKTNQFKGRLIYVVISKTAIVRLYLEKEILLLLLQDKPKQKTNKC